MEVPRKPRPWYQLHLSTCVLLMLTVALLGWLSLRVRELGITSIGSGSARWHYSFRQNFGMGWPRTALRDGYDIGTADCANYEEPPLPDRSTWKSTPSVAEFLGGIEGKRGPFWERWCVIVNALAAASICVLVVLLSEWFIRRRFLALAGLGVALLVFCGLAALNSVPFYKPALLSYRALGEDEKTKATHVLMMPAHPFGWSGHSFRTAVRREGAKPGYRYENYELGEATALPEAVEISWSEWAWDFGWPFTYDHSGLDCGVPYTSIDAMLANPLVGAHTGSWEERAFAADFAIAEVFSALAGTTFVWLVKRRRRAKVDGGTQMRLLFEKPIADRRKL